MIMPRGEPLLMPVNPVFIWASLAAGLAINMLPLGRNIDEMLRMVDALQFFEEHGEVCPAGWNKGKPGMVASTEGVAAYLAKNAKKL